LCRRGRISIAAPVKANVMCTIVQYQAGFSAQPRVFHPDPVLLSPNQSLHTEKSLAALLIWVSKALATPKKGIST
jgi:hypothetical protein